MVGVNIAFVRFINNGVYKIQISIDTNKNIVWRSIKNVMNAISKVFTIHLRLKTYFFKLCFNFFLCCFTT